jgi:hypothetical protein
MTQRIDKDGVAGTERQTMMMGSEAIASRDALEPAADESSATNDRVEHREQVSIRARFVDITVGASRQRLLHDIQRGFIGHEHQPGVREQRPQLTHRLNTAQRRQGDIEHDDIRPERGSLTDGVQPIHRLANDPHIAALLQQVTDHTAERCVVLDD